MIFEDGKAKVRVDFTVKKQELITAIMFFLSSPNMKPVPLTKQRINSIVRTNLQFVGDCVWNEMEYEVRENVGFRYDDLKVQAIGIARELYGV